MDASDPVADCPILPDVHRFLGGAANHLVRCRTAASHRLSFSSKDARDPGKGQEEPLTAARLARFIEPMA
jgi:hypothetical protein